MIVVNMEYAKKSGEEYVAELRKKKRNLVLYKKRAELPLQYNDNKCLVKYSERFPYLLDSKVLMVNFLVRIRLRE